MDIILKDVAITVVENSGADVLVISTENIKNGIWPFKGFQYFKTEIAKGKTKEWLVENFGEEILQHTNFIKEVVGDR